MQFITTLAIALVGVTSAIQLTPDNWDSATAGKTVFVKFQAPWWGHCKKMKPDWDRLMTEYEGHATIMIGDVDCTAEGKPLCDSNDVKGFPTIKHGDPAALEDYESGRDYASMAAHAKTLKPLCSPANIDLCDDEGRAAIEKIQAMSDADISSAIAAAEAKATGAEDTFKAELAKLQAAYEQLQKDKEATLAEVKASGLGLLKSVVASRKVAAHDEL